MWKRAWYFPRGRETMHDAVQRECEAVRESVGIFDATTLGKIEVVGPDAAEFLNRIYTNSWLKLQPGRCRYGLMLKEDGYIMDDGVVARIAEDRFHVTTTTGGAPRVLSHMEDYLQTEFTDLQLSLTSVTEQWAVIAVQGPNARDVVAPLVADIDMSNDAFPHMAVREGRICGVPCRLFRVSFTGEAGYEINVPADYGAAVWEAVYEAGKPYDITPYGTETMHVLRAEKGFIIVGQETDGTVTPDDVGLGGLVSKVKADFVGKRSLQRPDLIADGRKQLVGLLTVDPDVVLDEGAQIVDDPSAAIPMPMLGHVTSSYMSPNVARDLIAAATKEEHGNVKPDGLSRSAWLPAAAGGLARGSLRRRATGSRKCKLPSRCLSIPTEDAPMSEQDAIAERRHVFHRQDGPSDSFTGDGFAMRLVPPATRFSLRMDATLASAAGRPADFDLAQPINVLRETETAQGGSRLSARLGPDEWLLLADNDGEGADALAENLIADLRPPPTH